MLKKLGKIALFALIICFALLAGCSKYDYRIEGGPDAADEVVNNGGMAVKKGGYLFFINGVSSTGAENDFGKPVKGSIVRMDLTTKDTVIAVPKVVLSSYDKAGIFIFGDRIYYASPSVEKDKKGNRLTSYLDFFSTKLDGSGTKKITYLTSNSFPFKFYQEGGKVYLIYINTAEGKVYNLDCGSGSKTMVLENYSATPILAEDGYIYYNRDVYRDENKTQKYTYNLLRRVRFNGSGDEEIKFSDGKSITQEAFSVTLNEVMVIGGQTTLFYSKKSATDVDEEITLKDAHTFSYVIGAASDKDIVQIEYTHLVYLSANSYLGVYNGKYYYVKYGEGALPAQTPLFNKPDKILTVEGDYIYYLKSVDGKNVLHKKQYEGEGVVQDLEGDKVMEDVSVSSSGLKPAFINIGESLYFYFVRADGDYINYMYSFDISGGEEAECISIIADEDKKDED